MSTIEMLAHLDDVIAREERVTAGIRRVLVQNILTREERMANLRVWLEAKKGSDGTVPA